MKILSMDFGTSSVKLAVVDEQPKILKSVTVPYQMRVFHTDWSELEVEKVWKAMLQGIRAFQEDLDEIELLCFDTFSPSMVFMDEDGNPLSEIVTHLDRRSKEQTAEILSVMGAEEFQKITGILPFTGGASLTTVMWFLKNRPDITDRTYKFGHLNTFLYKKLTGIWAADPTNAAMSGLYETTSWGSWSKEIGETFGIPMGKLPDILLAGTTVGRLGPSFARESGLRKGLPVALGTNDTTIAQVAAGNRKSGDILNVCGSSEMISIITDKPCINPKYYLRNAVYPGTWQIFAITASGFVVDWFQKEFYREMTEKEFFEKELPWVIKNRIDVGTVHFSPYMAGDRQSLVSKQGGFEHLTLEATRSDMLAAILRGIHEPMKETLDLAAEFMELGRTVKLTGGMATPDYMALKRKLWPEMEFEQKLDCPILGNVRLALENL